MLRGCENYAPETSATRANAGTVITAPGLTTPPVPSGEKSSGESAAVVKEIGDDVEREKPLTFWLRPLERAA